MSVSPAGKTVAAERAADVSPAVSHSHSLEGLVITHCERINNVTEDLRTTQDLGQGSNGF